MKGNYTIKEKKIHNKKEKNTFNQLETNQHHLKMPIVP